MRTWPLNLSILLAGLCATQKSATQKGHLLSLTLFRFIAVLPSVAACLVKKYRSTIPCVLRVVCCVSSVVYCALCVCVLHECVVLCVWVLCALCALCALCLFCLLATANQFPKNVLHGCISCIRPTPCHRGLRPATSAFQSLVPWPRGLRCHSCQRETSLRAAFRGIGKSKTSRACVRVCACVR